MQFTGINFFLFHLVNGLAGHSWALDNIVALVEQNDLVRGAFIGGCFIAAWFRKADGEEAARSRRTLLATLAAAVLVLAVTKSISHTIFYPRPYMLSKSIYHLEGSKLREFERVPFNLPLDDASRELYDNYTDGQITVNHLGTFPSDNAGFFLVISLGIFFAFRLAGTLALIWTATLILGAKIYSGMHFPVDVLGGAIAAAIGFFLVRLVAERPLKSLFHGAAQWTIEHGNVSSVLIFIVAFEIASSLGHLYPIISFAKIIIKHALSFV